MRHSFYIPVLPFLMLIMAPGLLGCRQEKKATPPPIVAADSARVPVDSVRAWLATLDERPIRTAFIALKRYSAQARFETVLYDDSAAPVASRTEVVAYEPSGARLVSADSMGSFGDDVAERMEQLPGVPAEVVDQVLPNEPAWLSPRTRDQYTVSVAPDTVLNGRRVRVAVTQALPGMEQESFIRQARLYVEGTNRLVAAAVQYEHDAPFFRETSRFFIHVTPSPDGIYVPRNVEATTVFRTPFGATRRLSMSALYGSYTPLQVTAVR